MKTSLFLCVVLMAAVASVNGSVVEFTSSSTAIQPLITTNITLRCSLQDTAPSVGGYVVGRKKRDESETSSKRTVMTTDNVDFPTHMIISKDGVDIATISNNVPAMAMINSSDIHVTGSLSGTPGERGFLEITWQHPARAQSGNYRCDVDSVNILGHVFDFSKPLVIEEEDVSLNDLVSYVQEIEREKDDMKETIDSMKKSEELLTGTIDKMLKSELLMNGKIDDMMKSERLMTATIDDMMKSERLMNATIYRMMKSEQLMNGTIDDLTNTIDSMIKSEELMSGLVQTMNATISDQKKEIISLQQNDDDLVSQLNETRAKVFFSAGLTKAPSVIPYGQIVRYDHVFTNEGGAYQPATGVFTCPLGGFYNFIANAETFSDKAIFLRLQHNNIDVLRIVSYNGHGYQGSSNSAILKLDKGDTVKVISVGSSYVYTAATELTTTFSGQLIATA